MDATRQALDEYLDGMLDGAARQAVEAELRSVPAASQLLARMKAERAERAAGYASFAPSAEESRKLSARVLAVCEEVEAAPVGRIGPWIWVRRVSAVAAAAAIMIGTFAAGRMTAPPTTLVKTVEVEKPLYKVVYFDGNNEIREREFASADEEQSFVREMDSHNVIQVADLSKPGHM